MHGTRHGSEARMYFSGLFTGYDPTRRSRQEVIEISLVEWFRVRRCLVSHGTGRVRSGRVGSGCFEIRGWQVRRGIQRTHRVKIQDPSPLAQCETLQTESENTTKIFLNQARVSDNAELLHRHGTASPLYASNRQQHHIAPESRPGGCTNPVA